MKKIFLIFLLIVFCAAAFFSLERGYSRYKQIQAQKVILEKRKANWPRLKQALFQEVRNFKGEAGIFIEDLNTGYEVSFNKDKLFPSASIVKIPIMAAVFDAAYRGKISLNTSIKLTARNKTAGSGVLKNMPAGSVFTIEELIEFMIANSDNTAANMLIDIMGIENINDYFKKSGLKNTNLSRKMMDFRYRKKGVENYTTPEDVAFILQKIYSRQLISPAVSARCIAILIEQKIKNRIPAKLPPQTVVAHKTGLEYRVCHDAGIVFTPKGDFLICVLTKNYPNNKSAKRFISKCALLVYNYYIYPVKE